MRSLELQGRDRASLLQDVSTRLPHPVGPPPRRNRKKWPFVGTIDFQGIQINVEQCPGDERTGENPDGSRWATVFAVSYGEIVGHNRGTDGDRVDVFVGPYTDAQEAYVIREPDQDKVMLGFRSKAQARAVWAAHYDKPPRIRTILSLTVDALRDWLRGPAQGRVAELIECVRRGQSAADVLNRAITG